MSVSDSAKHLLIAALVLGCALHVSAQGQHTLPKDLADPGAPTLVPKIGGSVFGEGIVADWQGNVYSNEQNVSPRRTMQLKVGSDTSKPWRTVADNPNGMWLDSKNRIIICQTKALVRVKPGDTFDNQTDTLFAYPSGGQDINDLTGDSKDNLFFSNYSGGSVYFRNAATAKTTEVLSGRPQPNGVEWDEERKRLYVNEYQAGKVAVYTVNADYSLSARDAFIENVQNPDGITIDEKGNVYVVANGIGVYVYSPDHVLLGNIPLGNQSTNIGFGGADFKTLFMITNKGLYKLPMKVKGYKSGNYSVALRPPTLVAKGQPQNQVKLIFRNGLLEIHATGALPPILEMNGRTAQRRSMLWGGSRD